jgi:cellulose synthase/poly-beta-1,6-N-acetylglucosamine synthase-like glycosyltransferase
MITIFTPTHRDGVYLLETYEALKEQTLQEWQWVIIPNNTGIVPDTILSDTRVKVVPYDNNTPSPDGRHKIGALKRFACEQCDGDILVELDDDDLLPPNALEKILSVFEDPNTICVLQHRRVC